MSDSKTFTYAEVASHSSKKDLYVVIHDKVYNASTFIDEHPGGEEVLLDVAGQDATEAFEDVGHSDEARDILSGLQIGSLNRQPGDPSPKVGASSSNSPGSVPSGTGSTGIGLYLALIVAAAAAYFGYQYVQAQSGK